MRHRLIIKIALGLFAAFIVLLLGAGCGGDDTNKFSGTAGTATQIQCDPNAPSRIPAPKGKPQFVDFFRDT